MGEGPIVARGMLWKQNGGRIAPCFPQRRNAWGSDSCAEHMPRRKGHIGRAAPLHLGRGVDFAFRHFLRRHLEGRGTFRGVWRRHRGGRLQALRGLPRILRIQRSDRRRLANNLPGGQRRDCRHAPRHPSGTLPSPSVSHPERLRISNRDPPYLIPRCSVSRSLSPWSVSSFGMAYGDV